MVMGAVHALEPASETESCLFIYLSVVVLCDSVRWAAGDAKMAIMAESGRALPGEHLRPSAPAGTNWSTKFVHGVYIYNWNKTPTLRKSSSLSNVSESMSSLLNRTLV
jgi:hypothetical protein